MPFNILELLVSIWTRKRPHFLYIWTCIQRKMSVLGIKLSFSLLPNTVVTYSNNIVLGVQQQSHLSYIPASHTRSTVLATGTHHRTDVVLIS